MEFGIVILIAACLITAGVVYFVMEYRMYGERATAHAKVVRSQADAAAAQKELLGYTAYTDFLEASKDKLLEKMRSTPIKVSRDYTYVENIAPTPPKQKTVGVVVVRYNIEFSFAFDLKPENFSLVQTASGIEVQVGKPIFANPPKVHPQPHENPIEAPIADEPALVADLHAKLNALSVQYGVFVASDEGVLTLCAARLADALRGILATAPGVKHVPAVAVKYK